VTTVDYFVPIGWKCQVDIRSTTCDFNGDATYPLIANGTVWFKYCDKKDGSLGNIAASQQNSTILNNNSTSAVNVTVQHGRRGNHHKKEKQCGDYHYKLPLSFLSEPMRTLNASIHAKFKTNVKAAGVVTCPIRNGTELSGKDVSNQTQMTAVFTGKTNRTVIIK
jgi:hypothetical protein